MLFGGIEILIQLVSHGQSVVTFTGLWVQLYGLFCELDCICGCIPLKLAKREVKIQNQHDVIPLLLLIFVEAVPNIPRHVLKLSEAPRIQLLGICVLLVLNQFLADLPDLLKIFELALIGDLVFVDWLPPD